MRHGMQWHVECLICI